MQPFLIVADRARKIHPFSFTLITPTLMLSLCPYRFRSAISVRSQGVAASNQAARPVLQRRAMLVAAILNDLLLQH